MVRRQGRQYFLRREGPVVEAIEKTPDHLNAQRHYRHAGRLHRGPYQS